jgi:hypothetical protein
MKDMLRAVGLNELLDRTRKGMWLDANLQMHITRYLLTGRRCM